MPYIITYTGARTGAATLNISVNGVVGPTHYVCSLNYDDANKQVNLTFTSSGNMRWNSPPSAALQNRCQRQLDKSDEQHVAGLFLQRRFSHL